MSRRSLLSAFVFGSLLVAPLQASLTLVLDNFLAHDQNAIANASNPVATNPGGTSDALGDRTLAVLLAQPIQGSSFAQILMHSPVPDFTVRFSYLNNTIVQPVYTESDYIVDYKSAAIDLSAYPSFELDVERVVNEFDPATLDVFLVFNGVKVQNPALPSPTMPYVWSQADFGGVDFSDINDVRIQAKFTPTGSMEILPLFELEFSQFRAVPEPHTAALISLGLLGLGLSRRRGAR